MATIPTLTTDRLTLRPFVREDAVPLHRILHEPDILQYFPRPSAPDLDRVKGLVDRQLEHWRTHNLGWWAVQPHDHPELVGWNGLQYLDETGEVEIGYLLSHAFWGRGLATEGARAGLRYGFETLGLDQIIGLVHPDNRASQRVLEKLGMTLTGPAVYFEMDLLRYVVTADEWENGRLKESASERKSEQSEKAKT